MFRKLIVTALIAAVFSACLNDKKPTAAASDALSENSPLSLLDTTKSAEADATRAVSDKEVAAAQQKTKAELAAEAKKEAARKKALDAAKKKAIETAKSADKPKAKPAAAPAKPVIVATKPDKKGGKPAKSVTDGIPKTTENVKKRDGRDDVFVRSEIAPLFLGGEAAMVKYLQKNLRYPTLSRENGVTGTVLVQFVVEKDGKVDDVTILKGVDNTLNAEAKRVVAAMPRWAPGQQSGKAVAVQYVLPVKFNLEE
jgi:periplasmic protein TonB